MADPPTSPEETGATEVHQLPDCDLLRLDYEQTLATHRQLVEIRFKLLAFLPALSAAAVALLTAATVNGWTVSGLGIIGFVVTLGLVIYDRRNSQFHDGSIGRAEHLEKLLNLPKFDKDKEPGLFGSRHAHPTLRLLWVDVSHGVGLALVYSAVLGAWSFAAVFPAGGSGHRWVPAAVALLVGIATLAHLLWSDGKLKRLHDRLPRALTGGTGRRADKEGKTES